MFDEELHCIENTREQFSAKLSFYSNVYFFNPDYACLGEELHCSVHAALIEQFCSHLSFSSY